MHSNCFVVWKLHSWRVNPARVITLSDRTKIEHTSITVCTGYSLPSEVKTRKLLHSTRKIKPPLFTVLTWNILLLSPAPIFILVSRTQESVSTWNHSANCYCTIFRLLWELFPLFFLGKFQIQATAINTQTQPFAIGFPSQYRMIIPDSQAEGSMHIANMAQQLVHKRI